MSEPAKPQIELREACVEEAIRIIRDVGIEGLSLREVARRLGVSHQAPYRHYPSRDHLLAEIVDRSFRGFEDFLAQSGETEDPRADLDAMVRRYLEYACTHPLEYRLIFGARLPDPGMHPKMMENCCGAFDQLRACLARVIGEPVDALSVTLEAMFVWSTIHGLASIYETEAISGLGIDETVQESVTEHTLQRIERALPDRRPGTVIDLD